MAALAEETRTVLGLVDSFGALTVDQIKKLFEGTNFKIKPMISFLCNKYRTRFIEDNYLVIQSKPQYTPETLYCLWVMLDKIKTPNMARSSEIKSASPGDKGIDICFINRGKVIEYITFIDKTSIVKVSMLQDTFYATTGVKPGDEKKSQRLYTFVITDEEVMDILGEMELTIPFMIAYVEGDLTEVPTIEYYQ